MKKIIGYGAMVVALVMLSVSCASKPKAEAPVETAPQVQPYALPLTGFQAPYATDDGTSAELQGDTIVFTGGGLDYLLPADVDLSLYSGLYLTYVTSDWTDSDAVGANANFADGNTHRMQLSFKGWNGVAADVPEGDDGTPAQTAVRTDYTYPLLEDGPDQKEVSLIDADRKYGDWIAQEGVKGFTLKANIYEDAGIPNYSVKIISLELRP